MGRTIALSRHGSILFPALCSAALATLSVAAPQARAEVQGTELGSVELPFVAGGPAGTPLERVVAYGLFADEGVGTFGELHVLFESFVIAPSGQASQFYTPDSSAIERRLVTAEPGTRWCVVLEYFRSEPSGFDFELALDGFWAANERIPFEPVHFGRSTAWLIRWGGTEPSCA